MRTSSRNQERNLQRNRQEVTESHNMLQPYHHQQLRNNYFLLFLIPPRVLHYKISPTNPNLILACNNSDLFLHYQKIFSLAFLSHPLRTQHLNICRRRPTTTTTKHQGRSQRRRNGIQPNLGRPVNQPGPMSMLILLKRKPKNSPL